MDTRPRWLKQWLERHQHPMSFWLHMVGIPLTIAAVGLALVQLILAARQPALWALWWRPVALLVLGYLLQYVGHRIEGNDMGEVILVKKLLGRPYVAVSPRYAGAAGETPTPPGGTPAPPRETPTPPGGTPAPPRETPTPPGARPA